MADLISREAALAILKFKPIDDGGVVDDCIMQVLALAKSKVNRLSAVDAVEVGSCDGCIYANRKRPQKCSCCRRNRDMKDCYRRADDDH